MPNPLIHKPSITDLKTYKTLILLLIKTFCHTRLLLFQLGFYIFPERMNNIQTVQPGGKLKTNFNKILAFVGLGWLTSMVVLRYVVKPWKVESRMKENEELMNHLYDEQMKQKNMEENFEI